MMKLMTIRSSFIEKCVEDILDTEWTPEQLGSFFAKSFFCKSEKVVVEYYKRFSFLVFTKRFLRREHFRLFGEKKVIENVNQYYIDLMKFLLIPDDVEQKKKLALSEIEYRHDYIKQQKDAVDANCQTYSTSKSDRQKKVEYYKKNLDASYEKAQNNKDAEKRILMNAFEIPLFKPSIDTTGLDIPHFHEEDDVVLMTKFEEMSLGDYATLKREYKREGAQTETFKRLTKKYINTEKVFDKCMEIIAGNNFIWKKCQKNLLSKVLGYYNYDSYAFSLCAASNIEGLFSRYCSDCNVGEDELLNNAVSEKVRKLSDMDLVYKHEAVYYTFFFPIIRNRLMHGEGLNDDWSNRADLLLLDFYRTLRVSQSPLLHFNVIADVVNSLKKNYSYTEMIKFCAIHDFIEKKDCDFFDEKYKKIFINDVVDKIKKKRKIPYCCKVMALQLDKTTEKEQRALIFQNLENEIDGWYLCRHIDDWVKLGLY